MEEEKKVALTVLGQKATIRFIEPNVVTAPSAWSKETFTVWVDLEEPCVRAGGLSGFGIEVPALKDYNKKEFIAVVEQVASARVEKAIAHTMELAGQYKAQEAARRAAQRKVDRVKRLIGMT